MKIFGWEIKRADAAPQNVQRLIVDPRSGRDAYSPFVLESRNLRRGQWVALRNAIGNPWRWAGILTGVNAGGVAWVALVNDIGETEQVVTVHIDELRQAWLDEIPPARLPNGPEHAEALGYKRR